MSVVPELLTANERYAAGFTKGELPMPPARKVAVLTCMDARLQPSKFLGLDEGDAHVIRNAGGRASDDAIRSLIISYKLLGTREFLVIHHTDCGMLTFSNEQLREMLQKDLNADASGIDFLPFSDLDESVRRDVDAIRSHRLIPDDIAVSGYVFDVKTGRLREVVGAGIPART
ncbi:MAG TPA: carbonic anhydrase [Dehalococcoidia bacterium]|nr:carbonic anhydrase [Dehalococcoidia bacterium]